MGREQATVQEQTGQVAPPVATRCSGLYVRVRNYVRWIKKYASSGACIDEADLRTVPGPFVGARSIKPKKSTKKSSKSKSKSKSRKSKKKRDKKKSKKSKKKSGKSRKKGKRKKKVRKKSRG